MKKTESIEAILDNSNLLRMNTPDRELRKHNIRCKNASDDSSEDDNDVAEPPPPIVRQQVCPTLHGLH